MSEPERSISIASIAELPGVFPGALRDHIPGFRADTVPHPFEASAKWPNPGNPLACGARLRAAWPDRGIRGAGVGV
ncbi:hypothetical protein [Streptomyces nojiriensis]|uniref:hypothetical protein n=1 Tax=Streptomyces nojiriensis TaxID=66374 RepID=UPI0035E1AB1D